MPYQYIWDIYWRVRRDSKFLCSEALAYREITGIELGKFELHELLFLDDCVSSELHKVEKSRK